MKLFFRHFKLLFQSTIVACLLTNLITVMAWIFSVLLDTRRLGDDWFSVFIIFFCVSIYACFVSFLIYTPCIWLLLRRKMHKVLYFLGAGLLSLLFLHLSGLVIRHADGYFGEQFNKEMILSAYGSVLFTALIHCYFLFERKKNFDVGGLL